MIYFDIYISFRAITKFNLAPVGMGRATFRLQEIIQIGRIPVYLYEDFPWLPYEGSGYSPADLGYVMKTDSLNNMVYIMRTVTNNTLLDKLRRIKEGRYLYTYEGVLEQIDKWFFDPFGPKGGFLRCKREYKKETMISGISGLR